MFTRLANKCKTHAHTWIGANSRLDDLLARWQIIEMCLFVVAMTMTATGYGN